MSDALERRRELRVAVALTVELRDAHGFTLHSTSDVSTGGVFFDRSIPHAVGTTVELEFRLPGDTNPIHCTGKVVNVPDRHAFGMGVHFEDLSAADRRRLEAFVNQHLGEQK